jgi:hypothetical protein
MSLFSGESSYEEPEYTIINTPSRLTKIMGNTGGSGSKTNRCPGQTFGRPSMPRTSANRNEFGSWSQGRDQPSGISPGEIRIGSINTASGKSEMVEKQGSRRTRGNRNP